MTVSHRQDLGIVKHFHVCGGVGSGAAGFNDADPSIPGVLRGKMVLLGSVDVDPLACSDFKTIAGVKQTQMDLFTVGMYQAFWGRLPPPGWREATAEDIRAAAQHQFPDIIFTSMPCKGFSGLLSPTKSTTVKYVALNELTLRAMWLTMEAFRDEPPGLLIFENVPRIATRGRHLLDQIISMMTHFGYVHAETTHDCGELGEGLAQSRRRYLVVFRHVAKVPPFLYEPHKRPLKAVGDVLCHMPLPGDPAGGPMHRVPALSWKTWVRLAFVEAGSDWRSLNKLAVENGKLRDFLIAPEAVKSGHEVLDMRFQQSAKWKDGQAFGVLRWNESSGTIPGQPGPGQGAYSVQDVRHRGPAKHSNEFRIVRWAGASMAITSAHGSGQAVADPRPGDRPLHSKYAVASYEGHARCVIAGSTTGQGAYAVADMRPPQGGRLFQKYPVTGWEGTPGTVICGDDMGAYAVADHRVPDDDARCLRALPQAHEKLVCRIQALDGTWHRPFTTLELAALQSLIDPEAWFAPGGPGHEGRHFVMEGQSDQRWREGIGNAVPRKAAKAIGEVMGRTILLARTGETFMLGSTPIWVQPLAVAVSVAHPVGATGRAEATVLTHQPSAAGGA